MLVILFFLYFNSSSVASFFYSFGAKAKPQVYIYKYINKLRAIDIISLRLGDSEENFL